MMNLLRHSLASLLLLGAGLALAHAELETATPAQNSVVTTLPTEITLTFSEEVEVRFSLFKVYKLDETAVTAETTPTEAAQDEHEDEEEHVKGEDHDPAEAADEHEDEHSAEVALSPEQLRLNGLAGALVSQVLTARGDEDARADAGLASSEATTQTVTLKLKPDLSPGTYVVMWRALSVDTHSEQGYYVFTYRPTP